MDDFSVPEEVNKTNREHPIVDSRSQFISHFSFNTFKEGSHSDTPLSPASPIIRIESPSNNKRGAAQKTGSCFWNKNKGAAAIQAKPSIVK